MSQVATRFSSRSIVLAGAAMVLVAAMALDTKMVRVGAQSAATAGGFSATEYGSTTFPRVRDAVIAKAVDATTLEAAISKDPDAAQKQYAVMSDAGAEYAVRFTGVAGRKDDDSGAVPVTVDGLPPSLHVSVQTGPAITGTDLRDGTGLVQFGQFSNQIDYQNAGSALNNAMKQAVLARLGDASLSGKTLEVVGVFQPADPNEWVVTPVRMVVK